MKTLVTYLIPVIVSLFISILANGQSSKSCGACNRSVSNYSGVGDRCPHCGVIWGRENTSTKYVDSYSYDNYESYSGIGYVTSNANLRSYASKSAYVYTVVPQYSSVTILGKYGSWYHVKYQGFNWYDSSTGYVHQSLVRF
jgi:hypothetical protein